MALQELTDVVVVDLAATELRELNRRLHDPGGRRRWRVVNPNGAHAVACGIDAEVDLELGVEPARDRVRPIGVDDPPAPLPAGIVEAPVELAQRRRREIDDRDVGRLRDRH